MDRLTALNGESRVFTCRACGKVRHVKDAIARHRTTADLICVICVPPGSELICSDYSSIEARVIALMVKRTRPFPPIARMSIISNPTRGETNRAIKNYRSKHPELTKLWERELCTRLQK